MGNVLRKRGEKPPFELGFRHSRLTCAGRQTLGRGPSSRPEVRSHSQPTVFPIASSQRNWRPELRIISIGKNDPQEKVLRRQGMNLFLVLGAGAIGLGALHLRTVKAAAEPQSAQLIAAKATIPSAPTASPKLPAPGTALYETHRGDTVIS